MKEKEVREKMLVPKQRRDSKKNLAKVARVVLKKPTATQREIAEDTWLGLGTVNSKVEQLEQVKTPFIDLITDMDARIIKRGLEIIEEKLNDEKYIKTLKPTEISQVIKENTARYTLFKGNVTDKDWGLKITKDTPDDVLEDILFSKKK